MTARYAKDEAVISHAWLIAANSPHKARKYIARGFAGYDALERVFAEGILGEIAAAQLVRIKADIDELRAWIEEMKREQAERGEQSGESA